MIECTLIADSFRSGHKWGGLFVHSAVAFAIILAVAATPAWSQVDSGPIVVNTTDDITGAPGQGTQSFRWAVNEANRRGSGPDTIEFDLGDKAALDLLADDKKQITISLDLSPNEIFQINSELTITAPSQDDTEYFLFIRRTGTEPNDIFLTQQNLTLINVDLISEGLIFNGPIPGNRADTIDVVYEIKGGRDTYVLEQRQQEFFFQRPRVGNGRVIKTGFGAIAYLSPDAEFGGGFVLADGILETDADSLPGDIQICSNEAGIASTNCDDATVIFSIEPEDSGSFAGDISDREGADPNGVHGQVLKNGTGSLELTGDNSYAGGTYVIEGTLSGDTDAIQGEVHICPGVVTRRCSIA
jgi:autotransporter-associated beta strand protein